MKIRRMIGRGILILLLLSVMAILVNGQDEEVIFEETETEMTEIEVNESQEPVEPVEMVTRLDVTIIDGVNDKLIKLNNCIVYVIGELHVVNDSFTYEKTFTEGDRYEITIHFRPKK